MSNVAGSGYRWIITLPAKLKLIANVVKVERLINNQQERSGNKVHGLFSSHTESHLPIADLGHLSTNSLRM